MALPVKSAQALVSTTNSLPHWGEISPRWLSRLLPWVEVPGGIYVVNRVTGAPVTTSEHPEGTKLRATFADYEEKPRNITLTLVEAMLETHTRVPDLLNYPHDQLGQQLRLTTEAVKEEQERLLINSPTMGLLNVVAKDQVLAGEGRRLAPEDMDELLSLVWKHPAFFLAHPKAIAELERQCTQRGIPLESVEMFGVPFATWRGVPLVPSNKVPLGPGAKGQRETSVLLLRVGDELQGVVGLRRGAGAPQGVMIKQMNVDQTDVTTHRVVCYFSLAVLVDDALAVLRGVTV